MHRQRLIKSLVCAATIGLLAASCGDDDEDAGASAGTETEGEEAAAIDGDLTAYCEAELAMELAPPPDIDWETASPEEIGEAMKTYATDTIQPLAADVLAVAPEEIATELDVLAGTVDEMASTGDPSLFETPEVAEAANAVHRFDLESCGWTSHEVTATDYSFDGLPDELAAGVNSFELVNDGAEAHELLFLRKNDGVTQSAEELLTLSEEEAMELLTMQGEPAFAVPGETSYAVFDLEPGDYVVACFIPLGMTGDEEQPPEGPPHAMQGMYAELTVS